MKRKENKQNGIARIATTTFLIGSLGAISLNSADASQLLSYKGLGSGGEVRNNVISDFEKSIIGQNPVYLANGKAKHDKSGDDKKVATPVATPKGGGEGKCGEGKCGE